MTRVDSEFRDRVYAIVAQIPKGRVMTYGQVAAHAGAAWAAWEVGQIAHYGPSDLPWQRVVNRNGGLARGYTPGGYEAHKRDLEAEGVRIDDDYRVMDFKELLWQPPHQNQNSLPL
ncbi:MAG: MGMT family protein [Candidatus Saccharimonadales bacterium]